MPDAPRLFLITPPIADVASFTPWLARAMDAADVACVLLRTAMRDEASNKATVRALAPVVQAKGAAVLVENDPCLALRADADGVNMADTGSALADALDALHPKKIVGAGPITSRDAAMAAGESGVDYLMFGAPGARDDPDAVLERVAWWATIFNVPCVGYAHTPALAGGIADAGAEFIALCEGLWDDAAGIEATLAAVTRAVMPEEIVS